MLGKVMVTGVGECTTNPAFDPVIACPCSVTPTAVTHVVSVRMTSPVTASETRKKDMVLPV